MKKIIIAIDGFSSCGKSTLAKAMAKELDYVYVDTGAMYRAVTLYFLRKNINIDDKEQIQSALSDINISFENLNGINTTFLNDENVEHEIRGMEVSEFVSPVATISAVRKELVKQQRLLGIGKGVVMDGRDIGTVVYPNAGLKLFITADTEIRAKRRLDELMAKGMKADFQSIKKNLKERDRIDSSREDSPLRQAPDAILIDNSELNEKKQLELALAYAHERIVYITKEENRPIS